MAGTPGEVEKLLSRIAQGDRFAFKTLYERTSAKLFGVSLRILKNRAEASDALQEVYMKIWRHADRYRPGEYSPMSWLIAIARNHALDSLRARRPAGDDFDLAFDIASPAPDPEQSALIAAQRGRIETCLGELEGDRAEAVRGAYLDGYSYLELAQKFQVPLNTMRTWLRRSLLKLKDCLSA